MKYSVLILLLLIVTVVFAVAISEWEENKKLPETTVVDGVTVKTNDTLQAEVATETFTTADTINGARLQFIYPVNTTINEGVDQVKVSYYGLNNSLNTEITDGYTVEISVHQAVTVTDYLLAQTSASAVQPTQISGRDGYTYVSNPVSGEQLEEHVIFQAGEAVIEVTYFVAGPTKATYRELVWEIISSIVII